MNKLRAQLKLFAIFCMVFVSVFSNVSYVVAAPLSSAQKQVFQEGIGYYETLDTAVGCSADASAAAATTSTLDDSQFAQHLFVGVDNPDLAKQILAKYDIGGIFLMSQGSPGRVSSALKASLNDIQKAAKTPLLIATDQEYTSTVNSFALADGKKASDLASMTDAQAKQAGAAFGTALAAAGVNMDFAPVTDIQNSSNAVIGVNNRGISSDPKVIAAKAQAFSDGLAASKVMPVIKHFPGHGNSSGDSHQELPTTPALSELEKSDLIPYKTLTQDKAISVMVGHLNVPGLTNGAPASESPAAYTYLRKNLNFSGLAITDELANMKGAGSDPVGTRIATALNAGADMALFNVGDLTTFEKDYTDAKAKTTSADATNIYTQKRFFGLPLSDTTGSTPSASTITLSGVSSTNCCATTSAVNLTGKDNIEKILKYLLDLKDSNGKQVFTLAQATGIIGNFHVESGFVPNIQQGEHVGTGPGSGSWPKGGWGIAQWTQNPGRRGELIKWLTAHNMMKYYVDGTPALAAADNDTLLASELDFFWQEMQNSEKASLLAVQAAPDAASAAAAYEKTNERCSPSNGETQCSVQERRDFATKIYTQYADAAPLAGTATTIATPVVATTSSASCSSTQTASTGNGNFVFYNQWDPKSAWASIPYWQGTVSSDGCEPTAVAEIVATWKNKTITPKETAAYIASKDAAEPGKWYGIGSQLPQVFANYGLTAKSISTMDQAIAGLKAGGMVVVSATGSTPFTTHGHYIVLRGITADGQILIGDPNSPVPGSMPGHAREDYDTKPWDPATLVAATSSGSFNSMNLVTNVDPNAKAI